MIKYAIARCSRQQQQLRCTTLQISKTSFSSDVTRGGGRRSEEEDEVQFKVVDRESEDNME